MKTFIGDIIEDIICMSRIYNLADSITKANISQEFVETKKCKR